MPGEFSSEAMQAPKQGIPLSGGWSSGSWNAGEEITQGNLQGKRQCEQGIQRRPATPPLKMCDEVGGEIQAFTKLVLGIPHVSPGSPYSGAEMLAQGCHRMAVNRSGCTMRSR